MKTFRFVGGWMATISAFAIAVAAVEDEGSGSPPRIRVLLTGASGLAGSHALSYLLTNTDWNIVCPVSFAHRGLPDRITYAVGEDEARWQRVTIIKCDFSCPIDELTASKIGFMDYMITYASESSVDRSIVHPVPFVTNNVDIALHLLELARTVKPKASVLVSTDEVYGPAAGDAAHKEWSPIIPSNPYSASKAAQEAIAISYWRTYGVPLIIVNCMNLIGETQDPEKLVPLVISRVVTGKPVPIHASIGEDGEPTSVGSRFYLHARNLADAILFLLRRGSISMYAPDKVDRPDRWNVVGPYEVNNLEMAQLIAKFVGKPLQYVFVDFHKARPGHDKRYALNGSKIVEAGWQAPTEFEDSLKEVVDWTLANPTWARAVRGIDYGSDDEDDDEGQHSSNSEVKTEL